MTSDSTTHGGVCQTCYKPHPWGDGTIPKHPFNDGTLSVSATFGKKRDDNKSIRGTAVSSPWPFDPVLRQALVDKGIVSPEDLRMAEQKIRSITNQMTGWGMEQSDGEQPRG